VANVAIPRTANRARIAIGSHSAVTGFWATKVSSTSGCISHVNTPAAVASSAMPKTATIANGR